MNERLAAYLIKQAVGRARRQVRAAQQGGGQTRRPIGADSAFGAQMRTLEQQDAARRGRRVGLPPRTGTPRRGLSMPGGKWGKGVLGAALLAALGYGGHRIYKGLTGSVQDVQQKRNQQFKDLGLEGMY